MTGDLPSATQIREQITSLRGQSAADVYGIAPAGRFTQIWYDQWCSSVISSYGRREARCSKRRWLMVSIPRLFLEHVPCNIRAYNTAVGRTVDFFEFPDVNFVFQQPKCVDLSINRPTHQAILDNYRVSGGVFNIGTRGGRVSFYSQQLRAIQLATAFDDEFTDKESRVLVVGGGIAGVTFLTALRLLGFSKAEGFEAQEKVLQTQNSAAHRDSHPSANDWPMLLRDREFSSTTNIPFLNWYADNVANVLAMMRADPNFQETEKCFSCGRIVRGIEVQDPRGVQVRYVGYPEGVSQEALFDLVVCAVGFGVEANLESSKSGSYWWSDHIKHYRSEHQNYHDFKIYISGTGDGGLIDFCRAGLVDGNSIDGEEPNPAWALIGKLRRNEYRLPDNVWPRETDRLSPIESSIADCFHTAFEKDRNEGAHTDFDFADKFSKLVRGFRLEPISDGEANPLRQVYDLTRASFRANSDIDRLILLGESETPYSFKASPVNALLAGFLIEEKPEYRYKKGKVQSNEPRVFQPPFLSAIRRTKETLIEIDGKYIHIARNGSKDRLPELFSNCQVLKSAYERYVKKGVANDFILTEDFEKFRGSRFTFSSADRRACAEAFFGRYFDSKPDVDLILGADGEAEGLEIQVQNGDTDIASAMSLGGFDKVVFGMPAVYASTRYAASDEPVFE